MNEERLPAIKIAVRKLRDIFKKMRHSLDDGDCREYDLLDEAETLVKQINREFRDLEREQKLVGKALDKHKEV